MIQNRLQGAFEISSLEFEMALTRAVPDFGKPFLNHCMKNCYLGLALLVAFVFVQSTQVRADSTTNQKSTSAVQEKSRKAAEHPTQKPSASSSRTGSSHRSTKHRPPSKAALAAAARRRRAKIRPEPDRIQEIQQALAKTGYLKAEPNGIWDDQTRDAMRRYQADNGFPVTGLPEAKSLMKLGLGPHPLPSELDTSNVAKADANGNAAATPNAPAASDTPNAPQNPPGPNPQP